MAPATLAAAAAPALAVVGGDAAVLNNGMKFPKAQLLQMADAGSREYTIINIHQPFEMMESIKDWGVEEYTIIVPYGELDGKSTSWKFRMVNDFGQSWSKINHG